MFLTFKEVGSGIYISGEKSSLQYSTYSIVVKYTTYSCIVVISGLKVDIFYFFLLFCIFQISNTCISVICRKKLMLHICKLPILCDIKWVLLIRCIYNVKANYLYSLILNVALRLHCRASLVAQWLGVCLPMQGTRVRALVWEDPACRGTTGPVSHNCWACASGACAPQQERPRWWGPAHRDEEWPPLATAGEGPRTEARTQHSHK